MKEESLVVDPCEDMSTSAGNADKSQKPTRMTSLRKTGNTGSHIDENEEKWHSHVLGGDALWYSLSNNNQHFPFKFEYTFA